MRGIAHLRKRDEDLMLYELLESRPTGLGSIGLRTRLSHGGGSGNARISRTKGVREGGVWEVAEGLQKELSYVENPFWFRPEKRTILMRHDKHKGKIFRS